MSNPPNDLVWRRQILRYVGERRCSWTWGSDGPRYRGGDGLGAGASIRWTDGSVQRGKWAEDWRGSISGRRSTGDRWNRPARGTLAWPLRFLVWSWGKIEGTGGGRRVGGERKENEPAISHLAVAWSVISKYLAGRNAAESGVRPTLPLHYENLLRSQNLCQPFTRLVRIPASKQRIWPWNPNQTQPKCCTKLEINLCISLEKGETNLIT
jgi:hypothetical protein